MSVLSNRASDPPEERAAYAAAILDLLGDRDPRAVLRQTPSALAAAIDGLSADALRAPEAAGKWSFEVTGKPGAGEPTSVDASVP